jgi:hypothetical protein
MSHVIGTDLSAIQPPSTVQNVEFLREDSEKEWIYSAKFDYVHFRMTCTCFDDHRTVIRSAFENIKPGGWVEYQETEFHPSYMDNSPEGKVSESSTVYISIDTDQC